MNNVQTRDFQHGKHTYPKRAQQDKARTARAILAVLAHQDLSPGCSKDMAGAKRKRNKQRAKLQMGRDHRM